VVAGFHRDGSRAGAPAVAPAVPAETGDAACWAALVCPECGAVAEPGRAHRADCSLVGVVQPSEDGPTAVGQA
jgi:hypothetical protein